MFTLHTKLEQDTFFIHDLTLCRVLLMNNRNFPWLILVPKIEGLREIIDLSNGDRLRLMEEICLASEKLKKVFSPGKINIGALGNMVPQLHIHVIARFSDDPAWPGAVWGGPCVTYTEEEKRKLIKLLKDTFSD